MPEQPTGNPLLTIDEAGRMIREDLIRAATDAVNLILPVGSAEEAEQMKLHGVADRVALIKSVALDAANNIARRTFHGL
jgi:4-hydroxy-3-methylbut-2-enyl diphosphate reductase IspH